MKQIFLFLLLLAAAGTTRAQTSFATADTMSAGVVQTGGLNGTATQHYYKAALPGSGIFRLITTTANTGTAFGIVQYKLFWKNGGAVASYNVNRNPATSGTDTFLIGALQADSVYLLADNIWAGQPMNYSIRFDVLGQTPNNEAAANETIATAELLPINITRDGSISYSTPAGVDMDDYYKIIFPREGTLKLFTQSVNMYVAGSAPAPQVYVLDRNGYPLAVYRATGNPASPQTIGGVYGPAFTPAADTMTVYGRAADTMYIRLYNYHSGQGWAFSAAYSLRWTIADTAFNNEPEPNATTAQAPVIGEGVTINGSISHINTVTGPDEQDHFRIVLAKDATITLYVSSTNTWNRQNNPAAVISVLDKAGNPILVQNNAGAQAGLLNVRNTGSLPYGATVTDTMHVFGRAKDTFFVRVNNWHSGQGWYFSGHYTLSYRLDDTAAYNEAEPNHTVATAQPLTEGATTYGHVTYLDAANSTDIDDYYRIVKPVNGTVRLYITGRNTWGYLGGLSGVPMVNAYAKNGTQLLVKSATGAVSNGMHLRNAGGMPYGAELTDTMLIECVSGDTMYLKISNYFNFQYGGTSSTYRFRYEYLPPAKSGITYARMGNEFSFVNRAVNADSYRWIMGNGPQYTSFFPPLTTYVPGNYDVKLVAVNATCNYRDTATVNITVAGIEYYTPKSAGRGGDAAVQIFGGGLDSTTVVRLVKGPITLQPRAVFTNGRQNHLTAEFDLHFADTGLYNVVITVPGQQAVTFTNGFHIEGFKYPYAWSAVRGPDRMRTNTDNRFTLVVGNRGNVTASGVVVALVWPKNVQLTWQGSFRKPDYGMNDTFSTDTGHYSFPNTIYRYIYDSISTTTAIDSFEGKPYDGYIRFLQVAHVPAGGTVELPFIARSAVTSLVHFITYTHRPNIYGSCPNGSYEDMMNDMSGELIDAADMMADQTKMPLFRAFTKSAKVGQYHMRSMATYLGSEFWAWYDGYETDHDANLNDWIQSAEPNNAAALQTFALEAGGQILNTGVAKAGVLNNRVNAVNKLLANNPNLSAKNFDKAMDFLNKNGKALGGINYDRLKLLKGMFDNVKNAADLSERMLRLQQLAADCPELQEQLDELRDLLGQELDHQDLQGRDVDTRTSFDPNGIYGPAGVDTPRYLSDLRPQPFTILFENADTAGADAQEVILRDTVDKAKFDIASVALGDVVVANQRLRVPAGRQEFTLEKRLANRPGLYLRITAKTDTAAGVITWYLQSVDSATRNRPLLDGFLKPNVAKPEGEGSVGYTIRPRTGLADGTLFSSRVSIVFDDNSAIATAPWTNVLDIAPPTGQIASGALTDDTVIHLQLSGTDAASGIRSYTVHYRTNSGPWKVLGQTATDSLTLIGQYDSTYAFYATATDRVGNVQVKAPVAEYSVTLPVGITEKRAATHGAALSLFPNPAGSRVQVQLLVKRDEEVSISLQSPAGQQVATVYQGRLRGNGLWPVDVSRLPAGVYLVVLQTGSGLRDVAKLVVVH